MIYSVSGKYIGQKKDYIIIAVGGLSFRVHVHKGLLEKASRLGPEITLFTYLNHKEDGMDLYGFLREEELDFFELLISVSGVGPRSALGIILDLPKTPLSPD